MVKLYYNINWKQQKQQIAKNALRNLLKELL